MTKRLLCLFLTLALCFGFAAGARAESGDVIGEAGYTDIVAYINNQPIPSYNVGGYTVVIAEDLRKYGFDVVWDNGTRSLSIAPADDQSFAAGTGIVYKYDGLGVKFADVIQTDITTYLQGEPITAFSIDGSTMVPLNALKAYGEVSFSQELRRADVKISWIPINDNPNPVETKKVSRGVIVLDPGHGRLSGNMSDEQKAADGWIYNSAKGGWGEWRHWKSGTTWQDCGGYGCSGRVTEGGSCWYPIGAGDRKLEPEITLRNCMFAKKYLEEMGYEVRMTRNTNDENPSMTKRLIYCYPDNDTSAAPDADLFVCIHSNAGGGRGSAYIELSGVYDQAGIPSNYADLSNRAGKFINDEIVADTSLSAYMGGCYPYMPELILFCKSPIPIAYIECGFFDNSSDLAILNSEYEQIGKAIASGIDKYINN